MSSSVEAADTISLTGLMQHGNTACVTGASSGIGKAACVVFAQAGMNVWMVDIDAKELMEAQKYVKGKVAAAASKFDDQLILAEIVDVSDAVAVETLAQLIFEATGKLHILMNNAGIGLGGDAVSTPLDVVHRVMNVNLFGPIHGCVSFVPRMKASKEPGIVINTGSKQGRSRFTVHDETC
jgi:NAD(P)-dependent dehydrogenase (short-subunit alcohol dehydrogenase family)